MNNNASKKCKKCNILKNISKFRICRLYKNSRCGEYIRSECMTCEKLASKQLIQARKHCPPKPDYCECCKIETKNFVLDHDHNNGQFRGWLCRNCNQGIGKLGDNIEGIENALRYLKQTTHIH